MFKEEDDFSMDNPLIKSTTQDQIVQDDAPRRRKKKRGAKTFTADLNSLFQQAFEENVKENRIVEPVEKKDEQRSPRRAKALSGIDALIRQTTDKPQPEDQPKTPRFQKRVTFVFDKKKFQKLKTIARQEKAYLKDLIGNAVSEFIEEYETNNGSVQSDLLKS